jgi:phospholipid/cholesterol/gamma-HCH transport system substrate-binding protein
MASRGRKLRAGLFAIAALALLAFALLAFGGMRVLRAGDAYLVEYEGTVYGLEDGANVYMNGVRVGSVDAIAVSPDDPGRVRVRIVVRPGTPVRADTRAMLQFTGITGLKVIDLREGSPAAPPLPPGSMIAAGETTIDKLERRAAELSDQAVALLERANQVLDSATSALDSATSALGNVAAATDPGGELVQNARRGAADLAAAGAALRAIAGENRVAIRRTLGAVDRAVRGADEAVAQLKGVIRDNGAALRATMFDLRQAGRSLKELAREVRQQPSRLLFSRPPRERKLP